MSVWEPATFWGKYVNVVSGVELIWSWSYSILRTCFASIDSIYLLWFHSSIMDIPRSLQFGDSIGSKNHQRHFPNCINLSQSTPTNTHTYIYIHELLEICFATTSISFFPQKVSKTSPLFSDFERPGHGVPNVPHAERKVPRDNRWHTSPGGGKSHHFLLGTPW